MAIKKDGAKQKTKQVSNKTEESPKTKRVRKAISPSQKGETDFPIVGIGSSAGGLEALQEPKPTEPGQADCTALIWGYGESPFEHYEY